MQALETSYRDLPGRPIVTTLRALFTQQPVEAALWIALPWCVGLLLAVASYRRKLGQGAAIRRNAQEHLSGEMAAYQQVESFFGPLLGLPEVISALSPLWWAGNYPSTPLQPSHLLGLGTAALALLTLAEAGFDRRDLTTG